MSQKTSLQLVNKVLTNLREQPVTDFSAVYSQLILEFINQAKEKVEAAWRWKVLDTIYQFTTVTSQVTYNIASTATTPVVTSSSGLWPTDQAEICRDELGNWSVYDTTTAASGGLIRLTRKTSETNYAYNLYLANQAPVQPNAFAYTYGNSGPSGGSSAFFYLLGAPIGGRQITIRMKAPQDEFTSGTEILLVPWRPVVSFATYIAMEERGEELSERSSLYKDRHDQELQRAIERDESGEEAYSMLQNLEGGGVGTLTAGYYD